MKLVGLNRSPFVRRTAIGLRLMGFDFEHEQLSAFRQAEEFARYNPMLKAPVMVLDDGQVLVESTSILDYFERRADKARSLLPEDVDDLVRCLRVTGIALAAADKVNWLIHDRFMREPDKRDSAGAARWQAQVRAGLVMLEQDYSGSEDWLCSADIMLADVSVACMLTTLDFALPGLIDVAKFPRVHTVWRKTEALPHFQDLPLA